jgi:protein O-mannosyl-transferase
LLLAVAAIYGVSLGAPLMFDDLPNLVHNSLLHFDPNSFDDWRTATLSGEAGRLLRPLSMFSFAANYAIAGDFSPVALKAGNLLVHLLCALLIYRLAFLLFSVLGREEGSVTASQMALLAAAYWVLHPLHVSTVLYAVQRMAQLSTLFVLMGLVLYSQYRVRWLFRLPRAGEIIALFLWGALTTCLAMLSKENGVLLPWLALVLEVCVFRGRFGNRCHPSIYWLAATLLLLPVLVLAVIYVSNPVILTAGFGVRDFSLQERLLTQLRILWEYVYWYLWPDIRNMGFQHDDIAISVGWLQPASTLVAGLAWLLLIALAISLFRRFPALLLGVLFFLVGHSLESSVLPLEMVYEHRNYLPSIGIAMLLAMCIGGLGERFPTVRLRVLIAPMVLVLASLLAVRAHIWSDMTRFARANVINHPESIRAHFFYADALYSQIGSDKTSVDSHDGALLFAAREQFMKMNSAAGGHSTALLMLYFSDRYYLSELEGQPDWLAELSLTLTSDARLTASDYGAIESLSSCAIQGICEPDRQRILQLLNDLLERFPGNHRLLEQRYQVSAVAGIHGDRVDSLEQIGRVAPRVPVLYSYLVADGVTSGDRAGVYTSLARWLAHDRLRKYLPLMRDAVEQAARAPAPAANVSSSASG